MESRGRFSLPPIDKRTNSNDELMTPARENKSQKQNKHIDTNAIKEETKNYINDMKKGTYNILVAVRCRPLSSREKELSPSETVKVMDSKMVVLLDPIEYNGPNSIFKNRSREQTYAFDFAFDKFSTQKTIFENTTKFLLEGVVNGYNATVFAYGATGAGKTYTMLGNDDNPGIMPLTLEELFTKVQQYSNEREYSIKLWYLEIYNENIRDLLCNNSEEYLELREDPSKGVIVSGITELNVKSCKDILKILKRGNKNRTQEATGANETSSRSHAILQVSVEYKDRNSGIEIEIKYGKLSLIDLAGSERASATQNRGIRLIEGANINRSLLTLGNCINALCDANLKGTKPYIPYRDSKLTRLLKDSLGGNARTVMIANIAPSINTFDDTYNTLKYANRAKNIKTNVQRNVLNAQYHISNYVNIINSLKAELTELKAKMAERGNMQNVPQTLLFNAPKEAQNNINYINNVKNIQEKNKLIEEIKNLCQKQIQLKTKIINQQIEITKLNEALNANNTNENDISHYSNSIENNSNEISSINQNPSLNQTDIIDNSFSINRIKDKLVQLQNCTSNDQNRLREYNGMIERVIANSSSFYQNQIKDYFNEYMNAIVSENKAQLNSLDKTYESNIYKAQSEIKDDYITQLEIQLKLRDDYFHEKNINIYTNPKIKNISELKSEFKSKKPKINNVLNIFQSKPKQNNFLPPISNPYKNNKENIQSISIYSYNRNNHKENLVQKGRPSKDTNSSPKNYRKPFLARNNSQNKRNFNSNDVYSPNKGNGQLNDNRNRKLRNGGNKSTSNKNSKRTKSAIKQNNQRTRSKVANRIKRNSSEQDIQAENSINEGEITIEKGNQILSTDTNGVSSISSRLLTQLPQMKRCDLNYLLNEKNKKRQQLLDRVNNIKKDCL